MGYRAVTYLINKVLLIVVVSYLFDKLYFGVIAPFLIKCGMVDNDRVYGDGDGYLIMMIIVGIVFLIYPGMLILDSPSSWKDLIIPITTIFCYIIVESTVIFIFQTDIGKKILGFKICGNNGKRITFLQSLLRTTVKYLSISIFPVILAYPYFNKSRRFLHDHISRTKVVEKTEGTA